MIPVHPRPGGRSRRTPLVALLAVPVLAVPLLAGAASPNAAPAVAVEPDGGIAAEPTNPADGAAALDLDSPATVTLVTGDQVTVHPGGFVQTEPGPGREHITFDEQNLDEAIRVVPSDAAPLLAEGRLDERLFDVAYLIREGYDDANRDDLPLIVEGTPEPVRQVVTSGRGTKLTKQLPTLEMSTVTQVKKLDKGQLWSRLTAKKAAPTTLPTGVEKVWLDGTVHATLDESVPQIGVPEVWDAGYDGSGITVAVLDTGVDKHHPDLQGQVVDEQVFSQSPDSGVFTVDQLDRPVPYFQMVAAAAVPTEGSADPLVNVGRACVDSEGDELLADPDGKTALVARSQDAESCTFVEKYDAVVDAGATGVVFYNDEPGMFRGTVAGADNEGTVWAASVTDTDGASLIEALDVGEDVVLGFTDDQDTPGDLYGHGTHVASTIAGTGVASDGQYTGVAPGAQVMNGKVLSDTGGGLESWVIAGMEWAATNGAAVINLSLGGCCTDGTDPMAQAVNVLTESHDVLFVIAAGNLGIFGPGYVGTPGVADAALTVGAVDKSDELAFFSSRGPRLGDHAAKPNVTAPGVDVVASRAGGTSMGSPVDDSYTAASGTSMSTPHVAGAAALLTQARPGLGALDLKDALASTAVDGGYLWNEQGTGRVDVASAIAQGVYADASLDFGHLDPQGGTVDSRVTYTNYTDRTVILQLEASLTYLGGRQAGGLSLSANRVTVRPHRAATITATIDPQVLESRAGSYGGVITATGAGIRLRTAVGFGVQRGVLSPLDDDWDEDWTVTYENTFDDRGSVLYDAAMSPDGDQIFMHGTTGDEFVTAAVDATTGDTDWTARHIVEGNTYVDSRIAVSPDGSTVLGLGSAYDAENRFYMLLAAYNNVPPQQPGDPELGERLWEVTQYCVTDECRNFVPVSIAVTPDGRTVLVVGQDITFTDDGSVSAMVTIAYDAATGEQDWVSSHNRPGLKDRGMDVAISPSGELAYVTGFEQLEAGVVDVDPVTIAYELTGDSKGEVRWVARHDATTENYQSWHNSVSEDGERVFVASTVKVSDTPFDERMETHAYDAATGELLWSSRFGGVDHGYAPGHTEPPRRLSGAIAVSPNNDQIFIVGKHCEGGSCTGADALVTVAYDQRTGDLLWSQLHESENIGEADASALAVSPAVSPDGTRVYVAGTWGPRRQRDQVTLAYSATTGDQIAVARHRYTDEVMTCPPDPQLRFFCDQQGIRVFVSPDGSTIHTVARVDVAVRPSYWGISAYSAPISLTADAYRSGGSWFADLTWSGAIAEEVDVYRDGELIATVDNTGAHTDELGKPRRGSTFTYQVCKAGTEICSKEVTIEIGSQPPGRGPMDPS